MVLESEVIQKDKSVIGRGIAGALLFGGVGAVVGGMSAVGKTKEKKKHKPMFAISYLSDNEPDTPKDIIFDPDYLSHSIVNGIIAGRLKKAHKSYPKSPAAQKYLDRLNAEANAILKRDEDGSIRL